MPRQALASGQERIKMAQAVAITGENERTLQAAAARGAIPGATKPFKCWTFDEAKLRAWLKRQEAKPCHDDEIDPTRRTARPPTSTTAAGSNGRAFRSGAASSEEAYRQAMRRLRGKERANGANAR